MTRRTALATALLLAAVTANGCSDAPTSESPPGEVLVVFAASSLTGAFTDLGAAFEAAHPGTNIEFNFAGSSDLVQQISDGAPADLFAAADVRSMAALVSDGLATGKPVTFARNTFEIIVEHGNPTQIVELADLTRSDLIVVLCADTLPCGRGAAATLALAGLTVTPKSYEDNVKGVVAKVISGEADAGIVYVTDVLAAGDDAMGVAIPDDVNVVNDYPIVVTKGSAHTPTAQTFVDFVASPAGQAILATYGFLAP